MSVCQELFLLDFNLFNFMYILFICQLSYKIFNMLLIKLLFFIPLIIRGSCNASTISKLNWLCFYNKLWSWNKNNIKSSYILIFLTFLCLIRVLYPWRQKLFSIYYAAGANISGSKLQVTHKLLQICERCEACRHVSNNVCRQCQLLAQKASATNSIPLVANKIHVALVP